jgi:hypothetical protein
MWFATHTQDAQGSGEEAETGGTRLILISHDAPNWREQLEQALIDVGHPDPAAALRRIARQPRLSAAENYVSLAPPAQVVDDTPTNYSTTTPFWGCSYGGNAYAFYTTWGPGNVENMWKFRLVGLLWDQWTNPVYDYCSGSSGCSAVASFDGYGILRKAKEHYFYTQSGHHFDGGWCY